MTEIDNSTGSAGEIGNEAEDSSAVEKRDTAPPRPVMKPRLPLKVMLGIPAYGALSMKTHMGILHHGLTDRDWIELRHSTTSSLTHNFNILWGQALDSFAAGRITHFCMLHADIDPCAGWLDGLARVMAGTEYRVLSAISPIKDARGLTSTALDTSRFRPRRLTNSEIAQLPPTFSSVDESSGVAGPYGALLINTGCMLCDLRPLSNGRDWVKEVCFEFRNAMTVDSKTGKYFPLFEPEDWRFSRHLTRMGVPFAATREVPICHEGPWSFNPFAPGMMETDTQNIPSAGITEEVIIGDSKEPQP